MVIVSPALLGRLVGKLVPRFKRRPTDEVGVTEVHVGSRCDAGPRRGSILRAPVRDRLDQESSPAARASSSDPRGSTALQAVENHGLASHQKCLAERPGARAFGPFCCAFRASA